MKEEIKIKNVFLYTVIGLVVVLGINFYFDPSDYIDFKNINKFIQKISSSQEIAPERLFVNAWRITKNSYVDKTLNNQDWMYWRSRYAGKIKTIDDADVAINTILFSLNDPYTKFLKSNSYSKKKMVLDFNITSIGVLFNKTDKGVSIDKVLSNSSAEAANIKEGDTIVGIDGQDVDKINVDKAIESIEAGKTESVKLTIKRGDEIISKTITKKDIPVRTMQYKITKDNIGVINMSTVLGKFAVVHFKKILVKTNDTKGLIIDLRNNYGGILGNAVEMANLMLDVDKILSIKSRINTQYQIYSDGEKVFKKKPIIILINKNTASAAEILAGTLRDNLNAIIIGEPSFGKNSIQHVIPLQNSSGLILTTDRYILPSGVDIHNKGLEPDIYLEEGSSETKDEQMTYALTLMKKLVKNEK